MTNAPSRAVQSPTAPTDRPDGGTVSFVTTMSPPQLSEHLFGPGSQALQIAGAKALNREPFSSFTTQASRQALAQAQVLITGWGAPVLSDADLDGAPQLRYVLHAGGQGSAILPPSARERGIQVSNAGWVNAVPVAEFTVAMVVLANKQAFRARRLYRERRAHIDREAEFPQAGNLGKVVGIVGASRIGRIVIERLGLMDLDLQVFDPYMTPADAVRLGVRQVSLDALMSTSDVVTLHPPLNASTAGMITGRHLRLLRDGATLINTSRGAIIDQEALVRELATGRIEAILDVTDPEVLPADNELYTLPNAFLTPHISGSMGTEIRRLGQHVATELERITLGEPLAFPEALR